MKRRKKEGGDRKKVGGRPREEEEKTRKGFPKERACVCESEESKISGMLRPQHFPIVRLVQIYYSIFISSL